MPMWYLALNSASFLYSFDDVLAVVKHAFNGDVVDVGILQAEHLRALECAHFAFRRQHEDINAFFTAQGIFGGRAGIATGGAQDIEFFAFFVQYIFKRIAQELHGHVFECQSRAIGQGLDFDAV